MKTTKIILSLAGLATASTIIGPVLSSCSNSSNLIIRFNSNGGSTVKFIRVKKGELPTQPDDPTKDGYDFGGWYEDKELTTLFDWTTPVEKSITLYAAWSNGKVNQFQWASAFDYLTNSNTKNCTVVQSTTTSSGTTTVGTTQQILLGTTAYKMTISDLVTFTETQKTWDEFVGGIALSTNIIGTTTTTSISSTGLIQPIVSAYFLPYATLYSSATFNSSTRSYVIQSTIYGNVSIKFDGQARVSKIYAQYSQAGATAQFSIDVSKYGTTLVTDCPQTKKTVITSNDFASGDQQVVTNYMEVQNNQFFIVTLPIAKITNFDPTNPIYIKFGSSTIAFNSTNTTILKDGQAFTDFAFTSYEYKTIKINANNFTNENVLSLAFTTTLESSTLSNFKIYQ